MRQKEPDLKSLSISPYSGQITAVNAGTILNNKKKENFKLKIDDLKKEKQEPDQESPENLEKTKTRSRAEYDKLKQDINNTKSLFETDTSQELELDI